MSSRAFLTLRLEDLLVLARITHYGSASAAARALGVTTSQVTKTLKKLEAAIGEPLVVRGASGAKPNAAGRALIEEVTPLIQRLERAHTKEASRRIDAAAPSYLADLMLAALHKAAPNARFRLVEGTPGTLRAELGSGAFSLAVTTLAPRAPEWTSENVGKLRWGLFARPDVAKRYGPKPIDAEALQDAVFVRPIHRGEAGFLYGDDRCPLGTRRRFGDEVQTVHTAFSRAEHSEQLAFGPVSSAYGRRVKEIAVKGWNVEDTIFVLAHVGRVPAPLLARLRKTLSDALSESEDGSAR